MSFHFWKTRSDPVFHPIRYADILHLLNSAIRDVDSFQPRGVRSSFSSHQLCGVDLTAPEEIDETTPLFRADRHRTSD